VLILQCHLGKKEAPIWVALKRGGQEVTKTAELPKGVLGLPRRDTRRPPVKRGKHHPAPTTRAPTPAPTPTHRAK
jgi:hypothetical protein